MAILDFTAGEGRRLNGYTTPAEEPRTVAMTFRQPTRSARPGSGARRPRAWWST